MDNEYDAERPSREFEACEAPLVMLQKLTEDCKMTEEELAEIKAVDQDDCPSDASAEEDGSKTTNLQDSESNKKVDVIQIASVLLSDTSESDADSEPSHMDGIDIQAIQEEMYNAIKIQMKKNMNQGNAHMNGWIDHQRTMLMKWKKKQKSRKDAGKKVNEELVNPGNLSDLSGEIPKFTKLTERTHYSKKQIEEKMAQMDKEKRERWEKIFIQFELRKSIRPPVLKSDLRRDLKKLQELNGREDLVQYYKTLMANLKENVRSSAMKLEHVMNELEAKEQTRGQGIHHSLGGNAVEEDIIEAEDGEDESAEVSSSSEEELFLTEQEMDRYEELLGKNVVVAPNIQKIKKLLEMKIVFPEAEKDTVELGCTLREVERNLLDSKGLDSYVSRIVYFYIYKSSYTAESVKAAYEDIAKNVRITTESEPTSNKGCLLIYENVNMAIVMVEGAEFEVLKHLTKFKSSLLPSVKQGKILYIHRNLLKLYFNKWVTRVETPPAGKITYLTKSKKVLYRTAASRVVRTSKMLDRLYRHLTKEERYLIDPRSIYTKSKYLVMLPPPAMFGYLLKYNLLRDIRRFISDTGKPLELSSDEEELFAFTEDIMYSNYIDSGEDEEIKKKKLNYAKDVMKHTDAGKIASIKQLNDIKIKDTEEFVSWDEYSMNDITSTIVDSRIKLSEDTEHPAVRLAAAIEAHQSAFERPIRDKHLERDLPRREFLTFLERGSERWHNKMKWHGTNVGRGVVERGERAGKGLSDEVDNIPDRAPSTVQSSEEEHLQCEESFTEESSNESSEQSD